MSHSGVTESPAFHQPQLLRCLAACCAPQRGVRHAGPAWLPAISASVLHLLVRRLVVISELVQTLMRYCYQRDVGADGSCGLYHPEGALAMRQ